MATLKYLTTISLTIALIILLPSGSFAQRKKKGAEENLKEETTPYERANSEYLLIEAEKFFLLEDYKRSLAFLDQSLEVDSENHAAHFKMAEVHLVLGDHTKGLTAIDKAIELQQDNKYYYVLAAQLYKASNDLINAAQYYELMIANTTNHESYLIEITKVYEELGDFKKAIKVLEQAENKGDILSLDQKYRMADLLVKSNEPNKATTYLATINRENPDNPTILFRYASTLSNTGQVNQAIKALESSKLPTNDLKLLLAENYLKAGELEKQKEMLLEVYNDDEANLSIKTLLLGQWAFASDLNLNAHLVDSLQSQLELDYPDEPIAVENGALLYSKLAQSTVGEDKRHFEAEAMGRYKQLTKLSPGNFEVWKKVLAFEYEKEKWAELAEDSEEALDIFPNQAIFYIYMAKANQGLSNYGEAEDLLKQASRMAGSNSLLKSQILGKQGELEAARGNANAAVALFEQSLTLGTPHPESLAAYGEFLLDTEPQKTIELIDPVIASPFKNLQFIRIKATALFNLANYTGSYELLSEGLKEFSSQMTGEILELNGDILFKLNLIEEAVDQWKKAKIAGGTSEKIDQKIENKQFN